MKKNIMKNDRIGSITVFPSPEFNSLIFDPMRNSKATEMQKVLILAVFVGRFKKILITVKNNNNEKLIILLNASARGNILWMFEDGTPTL